MINCGKYDMSGLINTALVTACQDCEDALSDLYRCAFGV